VKQFLTIVLLLVYSFSSIGATVKTHLCAGKVQKCACAKSSKKDTCCTEKTTFLKKQDQHKSTGVHTGIHFVHSVAKPVDIIRFISTSVTAHAFVIPIQSKKSLLFSSPPIYALDCFYLI
jgi:hypothetical protein